MKSIESRIVDLERKAGVGAPDLDIVIEFVPPDRNGNPAPPPYKTLAIHIGPNRPEVPA